MPFLAPTPTLPAIAVADDFTTSEDGAAYAFDVAGEHIVRRLSEGDTECAVIDPAALIIANTLDWPQITRGLVWVPCTVV